MLLESAMSSAKASLSFAELIHYKPSKDTFAEDNEASAKGISPTVSEALPMNNICNSVLPPVTLSGALRRADLFPQGRQALMPACLGKKTVVTAKAGRP